MSIPLTGAGALSLLGKASSFLGIAPGRLAALGAFTGPPPSLARAAISPAGSALLVTLPNGALHAFATTTATTAAVGVLSPGASSGALSLREEPLGPGAAAGVSSASFWDDRAAAVAYSSGHLSVGDVPGLANRLGDAPHRLRGRTAGSVAVAAAPARRCSAFIVERLGEAAEGAGAGPTGWSLSTVVERTPQQLLSAAVRRRDWGAAVTLCARWGLDSDTVFKAAWMTEDRSTPETISECLDKVSDKRWVVLQCLEHVAPDAAAQSAVIEYGLSVLSQSDSASSLFGVGGHGAENERMGDAAAAATDDAWWAWRARLLLLEARDRLSTLAALHRGSAHPAAFASFSASPLREAAAAFCAAGNVRALDALLSRHPHSLSGEALFFALGALVETLGTAAYAETLPWALPSRPPRLPREDDWAESAAAVERLRREAEAEAGHAGGTAGASSSSAAAVVPSGGQLPPAAAILAHCEHLRAHWAPWRPPSAAAAARWAVERALRVDSETGLLSLAESLLSVSAEQLPSYAEETGEAADADYVAAEAKLRAALAAARQLSEAVYSDPPQTRAGGEWEHTPLAVYLELPLRGRLAAVLEASVPASIAADIRQQGLLLAAAAHSDPDRPGLSAPPWPLPEGSAALLRGWLQDASSSGRVEIACAVLREAAKGKALAGAFGPHDDALREATLEVCYSCSRTDAAALEALAAALAAAPRGSQSGLDAYVSAAAARVTSAQLLARRGVQRTPAALRDAEGDEDCAAALALGLIQGVLAECPEGASPPDTCWTSLWADLRSMLEDGALQARAAAARLCRAPLPPPRCRHSLVCSLRACCA